MLSVQKIVYTSQYSPISISNKTTLLRYTLISRNQIVSQRYVQAVPEKWLLTERDIKNFKIDPKVKKAQRAIIYSEYIVKKCLRLGHEKNQRHLMMMKNRVKAKYLKELTEKPAVSVALKYLKDAKEATATSEEETAVAEEITEQEEFAATLEAGENTENDAADVESLQFQKYGKPIYMPYAATDKYEILEEPKEPESKMPPLSEKYKALYEKYLESKETELNDTILNKLFQEKMNSEARQSRTRKSATEAPFENIEKVPPNWMSDYEQYKDPFIGNDSWKPNNGTPDPKAPISAVPCGGCGALLHCQDPAIPGYLPSELFVGQHKNVLKSSICQRCHFMKNYKTTLEVKVAPEDYPTLLGHLKSKKVAVIMMVDLTDFPCSIWPGIMDILGKSTQVYVVGNKVDLLPSDGPNYLKRIEQCLMKSVNEMGIGEANIKSVNLISAKTGYGVEQLINKLHKIWENKGDVYMIGCTNVGKSSLFNALIQSDYCKVQAADLTQRATVSPWPGTTLSLLKFPILNPVRWRLYQRYQRLSAEKYELQEAQKIRKDLYWDTKSLRHVRLEGHIGQTFQRPIVEGKGYIGKIDGVRKNGYLGYNESFEDFRQSKWFYDTPGTMHPDQVLNLLTTEELMMTLPKRMIAPRIFTLIRGNTLFIAGLGRIDNVGGAKTMKCVVFASEELPITVAQTKKADQLYKELLGTEAFAVPMNNPERLKVFPALDYKEFTVAGLNKNESAADIVLSSIGWVAITVDEGQEVNIKAWTPEGRGIYLRTPALLSKSIALRGPAIYASVAHKKGKQVYVKR